MTTPYVRQPSIHGDTVVFTYADDLWRVSADGGVARRLTSAATASLPAISPDGTRLAYVSAATGPTELHVRALGGGEPVRLTFQNAMIFWVGWDPDGEHIRYCSTADGPIPLPRLWRIPVRGGAPELLPYGPARTMVTAGETTVLGVRGMDPAYWKRYRGGQTGRLWIDAAGDSEFRPLTGIDGNLGDPRIIGDRLYFLSDHEGYGNVYSTGLAGDGLRRHTDHDTYYARGLSGDTDRLVYHAGGDLYLLDPREDGPVRVDVEVEAPTGATAPFYPDTGEFLHTSALSSSGDEVAITSRGKAFVLDPFSGPVTRLGDDAARYRFLSWLPDGERLVALAGDLGPEEVLVELSATGKRPPRRYEDLDLGYAIELAVSPVDDVLAVANQRGELLLVDITGDAASVTVLDDGADGPPLDAVFSPDGAWIAYRYPEFGVDPDSGDGRACIKLLHIDTGESTVVLPRLLHDQRPSFSPDGRYLYFIGYREFSGVYDSLHLDIGHPKGSRPYRVDLRPGDADRAVRLDGLERRVTALDVPDGRYKRVLPLADGKVLLLSGVASGELDRRKPAGAVEDTVERFDPETGETVKLGDKVADVWLSADASTVMYRSGGRLRVFPAAGPPPSGDAPGKASGWLDLKRVTVAVRPVDEWRQMLRDAWRAMRENFWTADMSGVDWPAAYERYAPLVDRVATRREISDLIWEMQGELGTSHTYEVGGDYRKGAEYPQGHLGADLSLVDGVWRVAHVVDGDPWNPSATSPLNASDVDVRAGDEILAVDGQAVGAAISPAERLMNTAGREVSLLVRRGGGEPRTVTVRTLASDTKARYLDWVEANRRRVHERSGGRVGYVHVLDMFPNGYATFMRGYLTDFDRDSLVVDVRFNGGGHLSPLVLEKLARRRVGQTFWRTGRVGAYPLESPRGPVVALANAYCGSDGDMFCQGFRDLELGPIVGTRTWGGVIGNSRRHILADNTVTWQPMMATWYGSVEWAVENHGVDPDIEVVLTPQDHAAGRDPQLDTAVDVALEAMEKRPPYAPVAGPKPRLTWPVLPPR